MDHNNNEIHEFFESAVDVSKLFSYGSIAACLLFASFDGLSSIINKYSELIITEIYDFW